MTESENYPNSDVPRGISSPLSRLNQRAAWVRRARTVLEEVSICPVVDGWVLDEVRALLEET